MERRAFFLAGPVGALLAALGLYRRQPSIREMLLYGDLAQVEQALRSRPKPKVPYWVEDEIVKNYVGSVQRAAEKLAWVRR